MNKRIIMSVLLSALFGIGIGCNKDDGSAASAAKPLPVNPIATVNFDTVFKTMGWVDEISKTLNTYDAEIRADIEPRLKPLKDAFEEKKKEIAKSAGITPEALGGVRSKEDLASLKLTPKQNDEFVQANAVFNQGVQQFNNIGQQYHQGRQQVVAAAYREALQPVIRRVAAGNNRTLVIALPNPSVAFSDISVDLTEKVIDDLQKSPTFKVIIPDAQHIPWKDTPATGPTSAPTTQP